MTATKYYRNPFAVAGDVAPIPDNVQPSGSVSYAEGFPVDYELVQTDPNSKDIPRNQFNQLMLDATTNIQQYQQVGAPNFITTADNGGSPYPYEKYAVVTYDDGVNGPRKFMSKVNSNISLPTVTADWFLLDNYAEGSVIDNVTFDGAVVTGNVVYFDSVSSTFKQALANGGNPNHANGIADVTNKRVFLSGYVAIMTGLTPGALYYLSTTTPGAITTSPVGGDYVLKIGVAKSATELLLNIYSESNFQGTNTANGYVRLPNGLIMQWGSVSIVPGGSASRESAAVTFPIPFPGNPFTVTTSYTGVPSGSIGQCSTEVESLTTTGFDFFIDTGNGANPITNTVTGRWIAIGN